MTTKLLIYVKADPMSNQSSNQNPGRDLKLENILNMLRSLYGDIVLRTDPAEGSEPPDGITAAALRWATLRNISVQHHGIPDNIIIPVQPANSGPPDILSTEDLANQIAKARREATITADPGATTRMRLLFAPVTGNVIWLGHPDSAGPAHPPAGPGQETGGQDTGHHYY